MSQEWSLTFAECLLPDVCNPQNSPINLVHWVFRAHFAGPGGLNSWIIYTANTEEAEPTATNNPSAPLLLGNPSGRRARRSQLLRIRFLHTFGKELSKRSLYVWSDPGNPEEAWIIRRAEPRLSREHGQYLGQLQRAWCQISRASSPLSRPLRFLLPGLEVYARAQLSQAHPSSSQNIVQR